MPARDRGDALRQLEAIGKKRGRPCKDEAELRKQVGSVQGLAIGLTR